MQGHVPRILIVDDEQLLCWTLPRVFEEVGFQPTCCATVKDAITAMHYSVFDLLITDYRLPDGSGLEIAAYAKSLFYSPRVIMLTAEPQHRERIQVIANVDAVVTKPFDIDVLTTRARALFPSGLERTHLQS